MHSVDGGVSQQLVIVGVNLRIGGAVLFSGLLGALGDQVTESNQVNVLLLLGHARKVLAVGNAAAADKADLNFAMGISS